MSKKVKIFLIILSLVLICVGIYVTMQILKNEKIEEEKNNVLNNANSLVEEISSLCKNQKNSEIEEEFISKYMINNGKLDNDLKLEVLLPDSGIIEVDDECNIALSAIFGKYSVLKYYDSEASLESLVYIDGEELYFNPETGEKCNDYVEDNSINNNTSGCLKWYAFNDSNDENIVNLLLDHNISSNIRWLNEKDFKANGQTEEYNNILGALTLKNKIGELTNWKVEYRLPSLNDILEILDLKIDDLKDEEVFFDSKLSSPLKNCYKGDISKCNFSWLYDRTSINCKEYGCNNNSSDEVYGYWLEDASSKDNMRAFRVYYDGRVTTSPINDLSNGIRPVISVQKSLLK